MDQTENEVTLDISPYFRVYKNGQVERLFATPIIPPSTDPITNVISKDVTISHDPNVSARLYLPTSATLAATKLPLVTESAFSTLYHTHLNSLTAAAGVISISIEYRLAPEHMIPACYDDCWEALKWIEQQFDTWIKDHADLNRVFLVGDSACANIAHNLAVRAGCEPVRPGLNIVGMVLVHPYFEFDTPRKLWTYICPGSSGINDPRINPGAEPGLLEKIECGRVLVCIAEDDWLRSRGVRYYAILKNSNWNGDVDIMETKGEKHVFHLFKPDCEEANKLVTSVASFINQHSK